MRKSLLTLALIAIATWSASVWGDPTPTPTPTATPTATATPTRGVQQYVVPGDMVYKGAWSSSAGYFTQNVVVLSGNAYVCVQPNRNVQPPSAAYWTRLGLGYRAAWSGSATYAVGDIVVDAGSTYICTAAHSNHEPPNASYWTAIGGGGGITNAAGANVITKSDGTNLVASSITDNASIVTFSEPASIAEIRGLGIASGPADSDIEFDATPPVAASGSQDGNAVNFSASNAVDGTSTHAAAVGGSILLGSGAGVNGGAAGTIQLNGNVTTTGAFDLNGAYLIGAANALSLQNSTSAQRFSLYNTYTSATNYERMTLGAVNNGFFIGTSYGSAGGTARTLTLGGGEMVTDAAPPARNLVGKSALPSAATNTTGGAVNIAGGLGRRFYTVVTHDSTGGKTCTLTANGSAVVITEGASQDGSNFECTTAHGAADNNACATNLAASINANTSLNTLMRAVASSAVVSISKLDSNSDPYPGLLTLTIATNAGAPLTATSGTDGAINATGLTVGSSVVASTQIQTSNYMGVYSGGNWLQIMGVSGPAGIEIRSGDRYLFSSSSSNGAATADTGISRPAAGVLQVTAGTSGDGSIIATTEITAGSLATAPSLNGYIRDGVYEVAWTNTEVAALAGQTGSIKVATLPAKTVVKNAYIVIGTAATGVTTLTVSVGRTSTAYVDYIVASNGMGTANTIYGGVSGDRGTNLTGYDLPSWTATTDVYVQFKTTTGAETLSSVLTSTGTIVLITERL